MVKFNINSNPSVLKEALRERLFDLLAHDFLTDGVLQEFETKNSETGKPKHIRLTDGIIDFAKHELCPYQTHIHVTDDDQFVDDQGRTVDKNKIPRQHGYLSTLLYWLVSSPWSQKEKEMTNNTALRNRPVWDPEDWFKMRDDLALYGRLKRKRNVTTIDKNIRLYNTPQALSDTLRPFRVLNPRANRLMDRADAQFAGQPQQAEIIWTSPATMIDSQGKERPKLRIIHVKKEDSSRAYGKDTQWCTAYQDQATKFGIYRENLLIVHAGTGERWQLHFGKCQFKDENDEEAISVLQTLLDKNPGLTGALTPFLEAVLKKFGDFNDPYPCRTTVDMFLHSHARLNHLVSGTQEWNQLFQNALQTALEKLFLVAATASIPLGMLRAIEHLSNKKIVEHYEDQKKIMLFRRCAHVILSGPGEPSQQIRHLTEMLSVPFPLEMTEPIVKEALETSLQKRMAQGDTIDEYLPFAQSLGIPLDPMKDIDTNIASVNSLYTFKNLFKSAAGYCKGALGLSKRDPSPPPPAP